MWWPRIEEKQTQTAMTQRQIRNAAEGCKGQKMYERKQREKLNQKD